MNIGTVLSYTTLFAKVLCNMKPAVIDINALFSARLRLRKNVVVDFRTPFSYELNWLGHKLLSSMAWSTENKLKDVGLVLAANERMAKYCTKLGSPCVQVIPNYPAEDFRSSVGSEEWRTKHSLSPNERIVLFTGGVRLKEIYGLDTLLESWKLVEKSTEFCKLVILGDDDIKYIKSRVQSLGIKRIVLPGIVRMDSVANWINCADVCVAPRTPGFSEAFYNDKDSTKISEYAAFKKPIVATSYSPSEQYLLVSPNPVEFAEGILKGIERKINPSKPHFWEENELKLFWSLNSFWSK
jgi:glycosyltransferase involved in cell wall biosynthesis